MITKLQREAYLDERGLKKETKEMKTMFDNAYTVGDLIERLQTMDKTLPVMVEVVTEVSDGGWSAESELAIDVCELWGGTEELPREFVQITGSLPKCAAPYLKLQEDID